MFNDENEKVSYCLGLEIGRSVKNQFQGMDVDQLLSGVGDVLRDEKLKLSKEEIENTLNSFKQAMMTQEKIRLDQMSDHNKTAGEAFLEENKKKSHVTTLSSGLQYQVLSKGVGASPRAIDVVTAHYKGMLLDGTVFDSSYDRAQAAIIPLNRVIPAWTEALPMMKVGDKWRLFVPPHLAYGEAGAPPNIGPNATLIFDVELLGIN